MNGFASALHTEGIPIRRDKEI